MNTLTSSRLKSARACQRKHLHRYVQGYRPVGEEAAALRFGTATHLALEAWWKGTPESRLAAAMQAIPADMDPFDRAKLEAMIIGYDARWCLEPYEVLGVELEFVAPVRNPATGRTSPLWQMAGKLDALVREPDTGDVLIIDHKTSSQDIGVGSSYWSRLRIDGQISIYMDGARVLGVEPVGFIYDVLKKPTQRPYKATAEADRKYKKDGTLYAAQRERDETPEAYFVRVADAIAEAPDAYFRRGKVVRLEAEIDESRYDIWQTARQIRDSELVSFAPRNPDACVAYGRTCEFFGVCTGEASLDDPARFTKMDKLHPELETIGE